MTSTDGPSSGEAVLAGLDPEQREVATALSGPVCVLAGAGTGKTRAITHRIAYAVRCGVAAPGHVLALTFTARAAGEMRGRLRDLGVAGVSARTFHAAALRQLQYFWPAAFGGAPPPLAENKARLIAESAGRLRLRADRNAVRDLAAEVEWAKVSMLSPDEYPVAAARAGRHGAAGFDTTTVSRLLAVYEEVKQHRGVIDFEDVLLLAVGILSEHPSIAATVRGQYRHFVVDEYQDVSALQQRLLDCWLGDRAEVCVVGDASQTIYSFAGADPGYLLGFRRRHPGAVVVKLVRDYRSTPQVVALANRLLDAAPPAARHARVELVAQRPPGPQPEITSYSDDLAEATAIAGRVRQLVASGTPYSQIAVLYRTNAQSEPLEQAFSDAGIGYQVRGGERFFARAEVRRAVMLMRGAARAAVSNPPSGDPAGLGAAVRDVLSTTGWTTSPPPSAGATRDQWESLQALAGLADELQAARPDIGLAEFVAELDARAEASHAPSAGGVTLSSLHAAKGLEWDAVFIVGLTEGLLPISFAVTPDTVEEERRLLYVVLTRAREHLFLSWTQSRTPGGRRGRGPSRFVEVLGDSRPGGSRRGPRQAPGTLHRTCRGCGKTLTAAADRKRGRCAQCPPDHDEALFEALRQWRYETSQAAKVPAFVVFTDATLEALAFAKPADARAMLQINGVGAKKLQLYGDQVLRVIARAGAEAPDGGHTGVEAPDDGQTGADRPP
jgi:DNA helicase-2/ATP-dependent DNA helicase PcrA